MNANAKASNPAARPTSMPRTSSDRAISGSRRWVRRIAGAVRVVAAGARQALAYWWYVCACRVPAAARAKWRAQRASQMDADPTHPAGMRRIRWRGPLVAGEAEEVPGVVHELVNGRP